MSEYQAKVEEQKDGFYFPDYDIHVSNTEIVVDEEGNETKKELTLDEVKARVLETHGVDVNQDPNPTSEDAEKSE